MVALPGDLGIFTAPTSFPPRSEVRVPVTGLRGASELEQGCIFMKSWHKEPSQPEGNWGDLRVRGNSAHSKGYSVSNDRASGRRPGGAARARLESVLIHLVRPAGVGFRGLSSRAWAGDGLSGPGPSPDVRAPGCRASDTHLGGPLASQGWPQLVCLVWASPPGRMISSFLEVQRGRALGEALCSVSAPVISVDGIRLL